MKNETARREIESLDYYLQNHTNDYSEESHTAMMMAVDALSSSENTNKWIPVSEKLPENYDDVLVWCEWWEEDDVLYKWWSTGYYSDREWKLNTPKSGVNVMAWMPLPEPYKAESEE